MDEGDIIERVTQELIERFGSATAYIVRELDEIADALPDITHVALGLIERFGEAAAAHIVRELAELADTVEDDALSAKTWHDIVDAIERLCAQRSRIAPGSTDTLQ
jgi:hypothetical protein